MTVPLPKYAMSLHRTIYIPMESNTKRLLNLPKRKIRAQEILEHVQSPPSNVDRINAEAIVRFLDEALTLHNLTKVVIEGAGPIPNCHYQYLPKCIMVALRDAAACVAAGYIPSVLHTNRITTNDAAKLLGCSPYTIKDLANNGLLPFSRTGGGHRRFKIEDINVYLSGKRQ